MVIRFDTTCPICGKDKSVFGRNNRCGDCKLRSFIKGRVKTNLWNRRMTKEVSEIKPEILEKLHKEILQEILDEEKMSEIK